MTRSLILGTSGHIDHGKTALVKALTGIDCDRLPEEKARGITIDIGFAFLDLPDFRVGIVDLPGHERFIMNMLAGATGVDLALFVVAADDSVMPQTREHLEILQLLGLKQGVIVLTKVDLVDETTRAVVEMEVRELVQGTFLENAPLVATSVLSGAGLPELRSAIEASCRLVAEKQQGDWFRMAIDRIFVVQGHGTVVTGTVTSGKLAVGEEVEWLPRRETVRIRGLQNHDQSVGEVSRGMRAALNLAGVPHEQVVRGQELATCGILEPSRVITVRLHCLRDARRPIKHRLPVRLHVGTAEIMGTVSLLTGEALTPGSWGLAQLFLEEPAITAWGQPFVIRESSASFTLGGGQVLQPVVRKLRRGQTAILERLEQLWSDQPTIRVAAAVWLSGFAGCLPTSLVRDAGLQASEIEPMLQILQQSSTVILMGGTAAQGRLLHADLIGELESRILKILDELHREAPLLSAHLRLRMVSRLDYLGNDVLVQQTIDRLLQHRKLVGDQQRVALADFKPKLSANLRKLREKIIATYQTARFTPPEVSSFAGAAGGNAGSLQDLFDVCVAEGYLRKISSDVYLHADAEAEMAKAVGAALAQGKGLTVADIRDLLGTSRKFAIPICEYLDRLGLTERRGDLRFAAASVASQAGGE
ncbi:selenocysteine-specific translation elongation factor [soil metagenome]